MSYQIPIETLLMAYRSGKFPMAEARSSKIIHWIEPNNRGIFPLQQFHISNSLRKSILRSDYQARFDTGFGAVLNACADRNETWINAEIHSSYLALYAAGHAHSQEIWDGDALIGGVYGVSIGGAFFGESMFSHRTDASKVALAWLIDRLRRTGFSLFDTQFLTPHLRSLGATEISQIEYLGLLAPAVRENPDITNLPTPQTAYGVIQLNTQTS